MKVSVVLFCALAVGNVFGQSTSKSAVNPKQAGYQFGTAYKLRNGLTFTLLDAKYSLKPVNTATPVLASAEEKILILRVALQNESGEEVTLEPNGLFTVFTGDGQANNGTFAPMLDSAEGVEPNLTIAPYQSIGKPSQNDPLTFSGAVSGNAKIDRIVLNVGRQGTSDDEMAFLLAPPPKGSGAAIRNFISPLPEMVIDKDDSWGAKLLPVGRGSYKRELPSSRFLLTVQPSATPADSKYSGSVAVSDKRFVVFQVAVKALLDDSSLLELVGEDAPSEVIDETGETYRAHGYRRWNADANPEGILMKGEQYGYRIYFSVPLKAKLKSLTIGSERGYRWSIDLSSM